MTYYSRELIVLRKMYTSFAFTKDIFYPKDTDYYIIIL